jgi:hypothetical protein
VLAHPRHEQSSKAVARIAGRHQVGPLVVRLITIDVVDNQRTFARHTPNPINASPAPMALVRASANGIPQNFPMLEDTAVLGC